MLSSAMGSVMWMLPSVVGVVSAANSSVKRHANVAVGDRYDVPERIVIQPHRQGAQSALAVMNRAQHGGFTSALSSGGTRIPGSG